MSKWEVWRGILTKSSSGRDEHVSNAAETLEPSSLPFQQVIFFHVPKTAGTSISKHIRTQLRQRKLGDSFMLHDHYTGGLTREQTITSARSARYIHGHFSWDTGKLVKAHASAYCFTTFRDPVERLISLYRFMQNLPDSPLREQYEFVKTMTPAEFLDSKDERIRYQIDNFMCRQFAGSLEFDALAGFDWNEKLQSAVGNMRQLDMIGFVNAIDRCFKMIGQNIGLPFDGEEAPKINVTRQANESPAEAEVSKSEFLDALNQRMHLVRWDIALYDAARELPNACT